MVVNICLGPHSRTRYSFMDAWKLYQAMSFSVTGVGVHSPITLSINQWYRVRWFLKTSCMEYFCIANKFVSYGRAGVVTIYFPGALLQWLYKNLKTLFSTKMMGSWIMYSMVELGC